MLRTCEDHDNCVVVFETQQTVTCPVCDKISEEYQEAYDDGFQAGKDD